MVHEKSMCAPKVSPMSHHHLVLSFHLSTQDIQQTAAQKPYSSQVEQDTHISMNNFQRMENMRPCSPFARILVFSPRPNSPLMPSVAMTACAAAKYPMRVSFTCRYVFTTRSELDTVSETTEAQKPMNACRASFSAVFVHGGKTSSRKLYVPNQG